MMPDVLQKRGARQCTGVARFLGCQKRAFIIELRQALLKLADAGRVGSGGGFVALDQLALFVADFHTAKKRPGEQAHRAAREKKKLYWRWPPGPLLRDPPPPRGALPPPRGAPPPRGTLNGAREYPPRPCDPGFWTIDGLMRTCGCGA